MDSFALVLLLAGLLTLSIGLASVPIQRSWISAPLIALVSGVVIGPNVLSLLDTSNWGVDEHEMMRQVARGTLAIGLMGVALRLPAKSIRRRWRTLAILILIAMPIAMLLTASAGYLLLGLPWMTALIIGAIACPTDPVVASSIVTGSLARENLPLRLRRLISSESGLNDGLAFPLVYFPLTWMSHSSGEAISTWLITVVAWETFGAIAIGGVIGRVAGLLLQWSEERNTIETRSLLGFTLALTAIALGAAKLSHTDDVLAVFIAGLAFDAGVSRHDRLREERIQETVNQFFSIPIFALLGLMLPIDQWYQAGLPALGLMLLVLLGRRLPVLVCMRGCLPAVPRLSDRIYAGWFGPIGVAAMFYATTATIEAGEEQIWTLSTLLITGSVVAHGITASPFTRAYGRRRRNPRVETAPRPHRESSRPDY